MFKTVVAVLFALVLCCDFIIEVGRKKVNAVDLLIRGFMILAAAYLFQNV